ncbi:hypothetical protein PRZ48_009674 [Zasmidium cellare]|uniref:Heterokaryon incompatibility domain-containing protein n=1 Tax=Zasmidium cellare TaxID=395010 RepID=A0ABR0ECH8_ZASCE|nr:hypothetical protein PRZ48_009674 [Zasmidium cellare]
MDAIAEAEPHQGSARYKTLDRNAIRLISFARESTPQDLHLEMGHYDKYMGHDDFDADSQSTMLRPTVNYTALSYCWGDSKTTKRITLNGVEIDVTLNLWQALSAISEHHNISKYYWTDALCIDQSNLEERNHQVHQMWRIYSGAEQVFAWLGPSDHRTFKAYHAIQIARAHCKADQTASCLQCDCPRPIPELLEAKNGIKALWDKSYFSRTWIMSEFLQARQVELLCGGNRLDSAAFEHANANLLQGQEYRFNGAAARLFFSRQREVRTDHLDPKVHRVFKVSLSLLS